MYQRDNFCSAARLQHQPLMVNWVVAAIALCAGLPATGFAQAALPASNGERNQQSFANTGVDLNLFKTFKYIPNPVWQAEEQGETADPNAPKRSPDQQRIVDFNNAGNYDAAGTEGLALLAREKPDDALQLMIANSLAWTSRLDEASTAYLGLTQGELSNEAHVGLANILRWRGRDHLAEPLYRQVLADNPSHAGAVEGLELAQRELSPRTTFTYGGAEDSQDSRRRFNTLNHRWRSADGANIMEIETSGVRDTLPTAEAQQRDITLRYKSLDLELKPSLELSLPSNSGNSVYASGGITFDEDRGTLDVGRVNWGRIASNPNALAANLSATHIGGSEKRDFAFGTVTGRAHYYDISDGNNILTTNLHLASTYRPFGSHIKPFAGVETRGAKFGAANYWSPAQGAGTVYGGALAEWGADNWSLYASGQLGLPLYGESGTSWSVSGGAKSWLTNDLALGFNLWAMTARRDASEYKAQSANISLEKLWR